MSGFEQITQPLSALLVALHTDLEGAVLGGGWEVHGEADSYARRVTADSYATLTKCRHFSSPQIFSLKGQQKYGELPLSPRCVGHLG